MGKMTLKLQMRMFRYLDADAELRGWTGMPCDEKARADWLLAKMRENGEKTEPEYSVLCAHLVFVLVLSMEPISSKLLVDASEHIITAWKEGLITADDLPVGEYSLKLAQQQMLDGYVENPEFSKEKIEEAIATGRELVSRGIYDKRDALQGEIRWAISRGDFDAAQKLIAEFTETPRTENSDCEGCENNMLIYAYISMGDIENADKVIQESFRKKLRCDSDIPEKTKMQEAWVASERGAKDAKKLLKAAVKKLYASQYTYFDAALLIRAAMNVGEREIAQKAIDLYRPIIKEHPHQQHSLDLYDAAASGQAWLGDETGASWWKDQAQKYKETAAARMCLTRSQAPKSK
jgi:hypothetical protein